MIKQHNLNLPIWLPPTLSLLSLTQLSPPHQDIARMRVTVYVPSYKDHLTVHLTQSLRDLNTHTPKTVLREKKREREGGGRKEGGRERERTHLVNWKLILLNIVQIVQLPSLTKLHRQHSSAGVPPVNPRSLDKAEVFEHLCKLLLIPGLLLEIKFIGQVCSHFSGQPLEVEIREDIRDTGYKQLRMEGVCVCV